MKEIKILLHKELLMERRNKFALSSILVYLIAVIYVCYLSFRTIDDIKLWNTLFWMIILFTSINAVSKSFFYETRGRQLYLYSLVSAKSVIVSKIIYNVLLMAVVSFMTLIFYSLFIGKTPLENSNLSLFATTLLAGGAGFAGILTLLSAIAGKTNNNLSLMAILGFPLLLPLLVTLNGLCNVALRGLPWSYASTDLLILSGIDLLVFALSYLLFPYLWRE